MKRKRNILENITNNICKKSKIDSEFNKNEFVSPSHLKNYVLKDPIIDYLEYYKINSYLINFSPDI